MVKKQVFKEKTKEKEGKLRTNRNSTEKQMINKRNKSEGNLRENNFFFLKSPHSNSKDVSPNLYSPLIASNSSIGKEQNPASVVVSRKGKFKQKQPESNDCIDNKQPFDKKLYRLKKYSKKYKLQQWEEKRKKALLREYQKSLKNTNEPTLDVAKIYDEIESETKEAGDNENNVNTTSDNSQKKKKPFLKPHERYQQIRDEKEKKIKEIKQRKAEREEAIKKSKRERFERNKKLSQKTKRGQPIMKYRIEMLLEKIENSLK